MKPPGGFSETCPELVAGSPLDGLQRGHASHQQRQYRRLRAMSCRARWQGLRGLIDFPVLACVPVHREPFLHCVRFRRWWRLLRGDCDRDRDCVFGAFLSIVLDPVSGEGCCHLVKEQVVECLYHSPEAGLVCLGPGLGRAVQRAPDSSTRYPPAGPGHSGWNSPRMRCRCPRDRTGRERYMLSDGNGSPDTGRSGVLRRGVSAP